MKLDESVERPTKALPENPGTPKMPGPEEMDWFEALKKSIGPTMVEALNKGALKGE